MQSFSKFLWRTVLGICTGVAMLLGPSYAYAQVTTSYQWSIFPTWIVTNTINKTQYAPGEAIVASGSWRGSLACNGYVHFRLTATTPGSSGVVFDRNPVACDFNISGSASLTAPTTPGSYTVVFNACTPNLMNGMCVSRALAYTVSSPPPTVILTASPNPVAYGNPTTLTWSTAYATSCTASGAWTGAKATSGMSVTGGLTSSRTYTLTCSGPGGSTSRSRTVTVNPPPPVCNGTTATIYVSGSTIVGGPNNAQAYAGVLNGTNGSDVIVGTAGGDTISGGNSNDTICGGDGNDTIYGGDGNDMVLGGAGTDTIYGEHGGDTIYGENGNDVIYGGPGNDLVYGNADNDLFCDDELITGSSGGDDTVYGGSGDDILYSGDAGTDLLSGGDGNDMLYGGNEGIDDLTGDANVDSCYANASSVIACETSLVNTLPPPQCPTYVPMPELTASNVSPTNGMVGAPMTLVASVTNAPAGVSIPGTFRNIFQFSTDGTSAGAQPPLAGSNIVALNMGQSKNTSYVWTPASPGTYYVRACADNDITWTGSISESDEGNNCSPVWTSILVATPTPTATLSASDTTPNYNTPVILTWSSSNATSCSATSGPGFSTGGATSDTDTSSNLTANATFAISCTGPYGTATDSVSVVVQSVCGDGYVTGSEQCDGSGGQCTALGGYTSGTYTCAASCTRDESACVTAPPACSDNIDNDGDGYADFSGIDANGDGDIADAADTPPDPGCTSTTDTSEFNIGSIRPR